MKTIIYGKPTAEDLGNASLFSGIDVTERVTTRTFPVDPMVCGEGGVRQQHWRMALNAEALICIGQNDHLVHAATTFNLPIYQA